MANEKRLIAENDVYALFDKNGTAKLHVADIDLLPRVDAVEVVHGRLGVSYMDEYYGEFADCLECGTDNILPCHYCRNCGAKMDGDGNV